MRELACRHPVAAYVLLAYAVSWAWWVPLALSGATTRPGQGWPTHVPGLLGPAVAAVVVTALVDGRPGLADLWGRIVRWRVGRRWWLLVVATALVAVLGAAVPVLRGDGASGIGGLARYSGIGEVGWLAVVAVAFLVNGLGEEVGWRGLAVERLLPRHGLRTTSLLVALMWAPWHLPTFWTNVSWRGWGPIELAGWIVGLTAGSVLLTWLYREARHSVLLVAAWHTAFNFTSATDGTSDVLAFVTSALVIAAAIWVLRREAAAGGAA